MIRYHLTFVHSFWALFRTSFPLQELAEQQLQTSSAWFNTETAGRLIIQAPIESEEVELCWDGSYQVHPPLSFLFCGLV